MKPSTLRCLRLLQSREHVSIRDFLDAEVGTRYSARIKELRDAGCVIEVHQPKDRAGCTYRLTFCPSELATAGQSRGTFTPGQGGEAADEQSASARCPLPVRRGSRPAGDPVTPVADGREQPFPGQLSLLEAA